MNLRWYIQRKEWWYWCSRSDSWLRGVQETTPVLQAQYPTGWATIATVVETTQPAGPKPKD